MKTWLHAIVLASILLAQFVVPGTVHSLPSLQETSTESPTSTPVATSTPEEPAPTATETPAVASETPSPEATETTTPLPYASSTATQAPVSLTLHVTPEFNTPGGQAVMHWETAGLTPDPGTDRLLFTLPEGMQPLAGEEGQYDAESRKYSLAVTGTKGRVRVEAPGIESGWIQVSLLRGEDLLAEASAEFLALEQFTVQASGGQVSARGGRLKISFPSGALEEPARVQVGSPSRGSLPGGSLSGEPFEIRAFGAQSGQELSQFPEEIVIELDYSSQRVAEDHEDQLYLYWYNEGSGDWEALPGWVDKQSKTLHAWTTHFTVFDTGVSQWQAADMPSVESFQVAGFTGAGTFSLPIEVPPGPGGLQPELGLSYNSQVVDQATVNTQASWVGMGWSLEPGSITQEANGTDNELDDTFFLNVAGTSTRIARDGSGAYRAASENFWRFFWDTTANTWTVWDKTGNIYYFEHATQLAYRKPCDNDPAEALEGGAAYMTYRWSLTRVWNSFSTASQQLTYTYVTEDKQIQGATYIHYNNRGCVASSYTTQTAVYPQTIVYPNGRYRVYFETEARTDYTASWTWDALHHSFERSRLKNIYIQDRGAAASFVDPAADSSQTVRRYRFLYETNAAKVVFPGFTYSAGGKVSTLASVQEFGLGGQSGLPAYTFTYGDGLHLTQASNGYGGGVSYQYDATPWTYGATIHDYQVTVGLCPSGKWTARSGTVSARCQDPYNELRINGTALGPDIQTADSRLPMVRPGGMYSITFTIQSLAPGMAVKVGAFDGTADSGLGSPYNQLGTHTYVFRLSEDAKSIQPLIVTSGGTSSDQAIISSFSINLLPGFHRVMSKTVTDGQGHSYTTWYGYTGAAMNTSANSSVCVYGEANCKSLVEANSEFRGHASVTETGPDGRQTITTYTQTDADAGQPGNSKLKSASGALLRETIYTWSSTDLGLYGVPAGYTKFGFVHNWIYPASTESRVYAANGTSYTGTRTSDTYQATYGNLTTQAEQAWNGSAWVTYRSTSWDYFPNPNNGRYLVGLPARQQVKNAAGSVLAETLNLYDGSNVYTTAPTLGRLTAVRIWVSSTQYSQTSYGYDAWGNGTSVTQYTGYGTASAAPTTGAQTSYTCYGSGGTLGGTVCLDDGYHSYPLWSKNALGHVTSVAYDYSLGVPVSETDPNGAVTTATYDGYGRILSITRPLDPQPALSMSYQDSFPFTTTITKYGDGGIGYSLVRKYDGMGRNFETTAGGIVTTTGYDGYGRVIWQSVPGGTEGTATDYDALGRPLSVVSPDGTGVSYSYDDLRTTVTEPDANGGTHNTVTATDVWGRVVSVMPPSGPGVIYTYDELDRLKAAERGGLTTSLTYDQAGRKLSMSDPDMGSWSYSYDGLGNLKTQTDARGCLLTLSYDALNRLVGKASSGAGCGTQVTTGYSYDAGSNGTGRRTGMTDASGSTSWSYDARGRLISESKTITGGGTFVTGWGYNLADLPATMTYPGGEVVSYGYNARMLLDTLGSYVTDTTYDAAGRMTQRAYGNGTQTDHAYYPWTGQGGRLQQILTRQMPSQSVIQDLGYTYDPAGNITQIANPVATETQQYGYDALDRLTQWRVNGHLSGQYAYDPYSGNLAGKGTTALSYGTPADDNPGTSGLAAWWSMDETSGMRSDSHGDSHLLDSGSTGYAAGVRGNAAQLVPAGGSHLSAADNPATSTGDVDFTLRAHVYLNNVNTTTIIAMKGEKDNMSRRDFTLFVDGTAHAIGFRVGNGTLSSVVLSGAVTTGRWYTLTAWHDAAANSLNIQLDNGTPVSASYSGGALDTSQPLSVGAFADGTYLLDGRVDELALYKRVLTPAERTWLYHNGQGRAYADVAGTVQLHAVLGAVTDGSYVCPQGETCDYDQAQTGVDNSYGYDPNGNQTTRTINGVTVNLSYDAEGHMVSVAGQGINAAFTYDGDGTRVAQTINGVTTYFVGNYYEQTGSTITKYYYAGSQRVAMKLGSTVYYLLTDHLGSTSLTLNASGNAMSELRYSAWGGVRYSSGSTPTEYTFTGQYGYDFGLMFYNARWYDPAISHFSQADTLIPGAGNSQAWDRYVYANNSPMNYSDPTGHCIWDGCVFETIALAVGFVLAISQIPSDVPQAPIGTECNPPQCGDPDVIIIGITLIGIGLSREPIETGQFSPEDVEFLESQSKDCWFIVCGSKAATQREMALRQQAIDMQEAGASLEEIMEATGLPEWRIQHLESSGRAEFDYYSPEDLPKGVKDAIYDRWGDGVTDQDTFFDNWNKYPSYDETNPPGGLKFENGQFVGRHVETWQ